MNILINGAGGQLGQELMAQMDPTDQIHAFPRMEWDVTNLEQTEHIVRSLKPDVVIHCAAYTHVDRAEDDSVTAFRINAYGARNVAMACASNGAVMVYMSTDYVFDGEREDGYDEWHPIAPSTVYGRSKAAGEQFVRQHCPQHFILRTSWLYGRYGHNFFKTIIQKAQDGQPISVVDDQIGCPTYTGHLAARIKELIHSRRFGTFHTANNGACTWYEFACAIAKQLKLCATIVPVSSMELKQRARRPRCSVLHSISGPAQHIPPLPHWNEGLNACIKEWKEQGESDD